jgi:hypothetical protein
MRFKINMTGLDRLESLAGKSQTSNQVLARAMFTEATTVLNESKRIVPVDLGTLKNSGKVKRPKVTKKSVEVDITYGGAAAPYALYVHEDPDARHADGKTFKYLERPFLAHADVFARNVKIAFLAWLKAGV